MEGETALARDGREWVEGAAWTVTVYLVNGDCYCLCDGETLESSQ